MESTGSHMMTVIVICYSVGIKTMLLKHHHHAVVGPHCTEAHQKLLKVMLYYMVIYFHYIKYSYNNSHLFCMPLTSL